MRIALLTLHLKLGFGVDLVVDRSARELLDHGHAVTVFTCATEKLYETAPYNIKLLDRIEGFPANPFSLQFLKRFQAFITETSRADVWIVHSPPFERRIILYPGKVIFWEHGTPPGSFFSKAQGALLDWTSWYRHHKVYAAHGSTACRIVAISEYIRTTLPDSIQGNAVVIHNGCDHYSRCASESAISIRAELGVRDEEILIANIGRFELYDDPQPYKGITDLLELYRNLGNATPRKKLLVIGRFSDRTISELQQLGILVESEVAPERLPAFYSASDIVISTSHWEGFNLPLLEAQYQGVPVVAFKIGPHPEVVSHGESGLLAESPGQFLSNLELLAAHADKRQELSQGALRFSSRFTWRNHGSALDSLVRELVVVEHTGKSNRIGGEDGDTAISLLPRFGHLFYRSQMLWWLLKARGAATVFLLTVSWVRHLFGRRFKLR